MPNSPIQYIDRASGQIITEQTPSGAFMRFLYGKNPFGKLLLHSLFKRKCISAIAGKYMNSKASAKRVQPFIEDFNVPMEDYIIPETGYASFNDFFYRHIQTNARPIGDGVVSPADGKILVFPEITHSQQFFVKGKAFSVATLLGDEELAKQYIGGSMAIIRLAPTDYHRYHFPVDGQVSDNKKINGYYFSVSPLALQKNLQIFLENKREYVVVDSAYGKVCIVDVAATMTGSMIQTHQAHTQITKGQEKGYFAFGGSTIILLFEKNTIKFSEDLITNTQNGMETSILMGETIATLL
ncbi:MAG: archaetidylserine decarboxylase [Flavobacteriaceae bacterium]|nr:archaetidylserine decarboxylase [Flavobacteriaceae bacterium]